MANVGKLPYGVLGTALKFGLSEEIEFVPVFTSSKQRRKFFFFFYGGVRTVCKEKRTGPAKFVVFFILFLGSFLSPSPSSLLPGFIDVRKRLGIRTRF